MKEKERKFWINSIMGQDSRSVWLAQSRASNVPKSERTLYDIANTLIPAEVL